MFVVSKFSPNFNEVNFVQSEKILCVDFLNPNEQSIIACITSGLSESTL